MRPILISSPPAAKACVALLIAAAAPAAMPPRRKSRRDFFDTYSALLFGSFVVMGSGFWFLDTRCSKLDAGFEPKLGPEGGILWWDIQYPESRIQHLGVMPL